MLVLSRKIMEALIVGSAHGIGGGLKVTVLEIRQDRVKLGFSMNDNIPVVRWELMNREQLDPEAAEVVTNRSDRALPARSRN
jgi:carbon storage regulator CsrA